MSTRLPAGLTLANWDLGGEPSAWAYLHAGDLFPHVEIPTALPVARLPEDELSEVARFPVEPALDEYVAAAPVSGIVVVQGGRICYERYPRMSPDDRHLLMSVTKVLPATLVGILHRRGLLDLERPAHTVVGELAGGGWAGVRIDDILNMRSGIDCLEVAGEAYEYTGVNTFVLSWLVERVTGLGFAEVLAREIWTRGGFQAPALLCVSPTGAPASHGGLCTTLRDLARFGMLFTPSAHLVADARIVDRDHLRQIQTSGRKQLHRHPGELAAPARTAYGDDLPPASRQWNFAMGDGDLFKGGFGGQGLYVSPARDLVIAFAGTPRADGSSNLLRWFSRRIATEIFGPSRTTPQRG